MNTTVHMTNDVFGVSRDTPLNYAERQADADFVDSLTRGQHIVIHGSSKQGKTSLRKYNLADDDYILVTCSNRWDLPQLMESILKRVGYTVEQSTKTTVSGQAKISIGAKISGKLFGNGAEANASADFTKQTADEKTWRHLELDPADINDIIGALEDIDFNKWIILEDFHYLPEKTQRDFAVALKAFHEQSPYTFIIVGVWLQEDRLIQYNGDLIGRVTTINADEWSRSELADAITQGEDLMNVRFSTSFTADLLDNCFNSIYVLQETCRETLTQIGVTRSPDSRREIDTDSIEIIKKVVNRQSGRYLEFLTNFAQGFGSTTLEMYKWILVPIIMKEHSTLESGVSYRDIRKILDRIHPGGPINAGNVTIALTKITELQVKKGMKPVVFDYDQSLRTLTIVDRSFIIWLAFQDKTELLAHLELPSNIATEWAAQTAP